MYNNTFIQSPKLIYGLSRFQVIGPISVRHLAFPPVKEIPHRWIAQSHKTRKNVVKVPAGDLGSLSLQTWRLDSRHTHVILQFKSAQVRGCCCTQDLLMVYVGRI